MKFLQQLKAASLSDDVSPDINGAPADFGAPFGGYKQSGNGREWGDFGFEEFLEVKAVMGAFRIEKRPKAS